MYAVIKTGGKQYRVQPGDLLVVEKLEGEAFAQRSGVRPGADAWRRGRGSLRRQPDGGRRRGPRDPDRDPQGRQDQGLQEDPSPGLSPHPGPPAVRNRPSGHRPGRRGQERQVGRDRRPDPARGPGRPRPRPDPAGDRDPGARRPRPWPPRRLRPKARSEGRSRRAAPKRPWPKRRRRLPRRKAAAPKAEKPATEAKAKADAKPAKAEAAPKKAAAPKAAAPQAPPKSPKGGKA